MMRFFSILLVSLSLMSLGCKRVAETGFRDGDRCTVELHSAPAEPWSAGTKVTLGMLVKLERANGELAYLMDTDVVPEQATMKAVISFWDGRRMMGEPLEVPFVRDC